MALVASQSGDDPGPIQVTLAPAIRRLEADLGLSSRDLAHSLGVERRTLDRWTSGDAYPRAGARQQLVRLVALHTRLTETFETRQAARAWLHRPMPYLGNTAPADAVKDGRLDRVEAALEAIDSGFAS